MVEGARLESVYTGNRIKGSNPLVSANLDPDSQIKEINYLIILLFSATNTFFSILPELVKVFLSKLCLARTKSLYNTSVEEGLQSEKLLEKIFDTCTPVNIINGAATLQLLSLLWLKVKLGPSVLSSLPPRYTFSNVPFCELKLLCRMMIFSAL